MPYKNKEDKNTYLRKWRVKNPDKIKAIRYRSNRKCSDQIATYNMDYHKQKPWKRLLLAAKKRSKKSGIEFSITDEWISSKWTGRCSLTNIEFYVGPSGDLGANSLSPSLDRIDNSKGYTPNNCRIILWCINRFKGAMTDREMIKMIKVLYDRFY